MLEKLGNQTNEKIESIEKTHKNNKELFIEMMQ